LIKATLENAALQFRYCEKATKLEKKIPNLFHTTLNNVKTTWKILSKFCGLLTISELYEECELRKDFTPLSVSSMMQ
jgi:hypothetical protein